MGREKRFFAALRMTKRRGAGGKILRCAQNDRGGGARNDGGRERRFFASLRMTEKAQNDRGKKLSF